MVTEVYNDSSDHLPPTETSDFWGSLEMLATAGQNLDLETAVSQILRGVTSLCAADYAVVYKISEDKPVLEIYQSRGAGVLFPEQINTQDLASLGNLQMWQTGKRSTTFFHRFARKEKLAYLITIPLGEPNAVIGILVIAGMETPPTNITEITEYSAIVLTTIFQQHAWRANAEQGLRNSESKLNSAKTIEERISDGLIILAPDLKIKRLNLAAETILGYKQQEVKGQPISKVLIGAEALHQALVNAQNSSATLRLGSNVRLYKRNGEVFQSIVRIFPVIQDCQVGEILVLFQDLSEQEFIRQQAQQLEQRAYLGEVTATFAHEIRNPVHNISTGLQLMALNLPKNDPNQQTIDYMLQDCDRLAELIKAVLAFSKPIDYQMENLDIVNLLQQFMERQHARIERANVKYELQIAQDCPQVVGNLHALEQVIGNLVTNAIQAMSPGGGRLVIKAQPASATEGRSFVEISVADTGPGIPKENQERVFQPFFTTEHNGTGLGLAVSKRIVTAHKGTIRLTSFPGGTIFHIQLPAVRSS